MDWVRKSAWAACVAVLALGLSRCASSDSNGSSPVAAGDSGTDGALPNTDATIPLTDASQPAADGGDGSADAGPAPSCPSPEVDAGGPSFTLSAGPGAGASGVSIALDGTGKGRVFDGIGAISGGGGNTRLLYDYPEPYRSQVLDYLFKPGVGADLHILKVEIGGDMNSTDGSEASHMHTASDLGCNRGYEWWLMAEAKARNPAIKLYALAWGAPGWIGGGNFWSQDMIDYLMKWLGCAKTNGLTIDYLGGWNERSYDKNWYEKLHAALAAGGGTGIKVVGADDSWDVTNDMTSDSAFKAAVDIVGVHYPCGGDGAPATSCPANAAGLALGVPLWASENGSQDLNTGAPAMIRAIVRGYIDAKMTAYINWPIVAAIPPSIPWETMGLVQANVPWSGWYEIGLQTWTTAQVTQFTQPGWSFIDSASGYLGGNNANGGYVTLKGPAGGDYSVILETTTATSPQTVSFTTTGGLSTGNVHVWITDLDSHKAADYFVHAGDVTPNGGAFWVTLPPNTITSITTTTGQGKGTAKGAEPRAAILPYAESFESYAAGTLAPYIADQTGAFDVEPCSGGRSGQCLRQMSPVVPIGWNRDEYAYNTVGTDDWADYEVGVDVMLEKPGSVEVLGRFNGRAYGLIAQVYTYFLSVADTGAWSIVRGNNDGTRTTLTSGTVAALGTMKWHHLSFSLVGTKLAASIDGTVAGETNDSTYTVGPAGLGVGLVSTSWLNAQFDNLAITPKSPLSTPFSDTLVNRASGLALDVTGQSMTDGALLAQAPLSGGASQTWQLAGDRSGYTVLLNENSGKAIGAPSAVAGGAVDQETPDGKGAVHWTLEPAGGVFYRLITPGGLAVAAASSGSAITLATLDCTSNAQQWSLTAAPTPNATYVIINHQTGWAVDVNAGSTVTGATVLQWPAHGGANQQWRFAPAAGGGFILRNGNSNLALDVVTGGADQATPSGAATQTWTLKNAASAGYYTLTSGGGGVLGSPSATQGAQLSVGPATGGAAQEWMLTAQ